MIRCKLDLLEGDQVKRQLADLEQVERQQLAGDQVERPGGLRPAGP